MAFMLVGIVLAGCGKSDRMSDEQAMDMYNRAKMLEMEQVKKDTKILFQVVKIGQQIYLVEGHDSIPLQNWEAERVTAFSFLFDNQGHVSRSISESAKGISYTISETR